MAEASLIDFTNAPLTPGALFDAAAARTELPPRDGQTFDEYLKPFPDQKTTHCLEAAFEAALRADVATVRHWVRLADEAWRVWCRDNRVTPSS